MLCDAPYKSLAFINGIVCYDQTGVGHSAIYYCLNCGFNTFKESMSVRTCLSNGSWNGMIPHCDCSKALCGNELNVPCKLTTVLLFR